MMKKTLVLLIFIVFFGSGPTNANAFWWLIVRSVISSEVKHKHHHNLHSKKENKSRFDRDADYDGYNPYHNHPDGKYSHEYTENHEKRW